MRTLMRNLRLEATAFVAFFFPAFEALAFLAAAFLAAAFLAGFLTAFLVARFLALFLVVFRAGMLFTRLCEVMQTVRGRVRYRRSSCCE